MVEQARDVAEGDGGLLFVLSQDQNLAALAERESCVFA
jgi:hypothetical protein